jgi:hypothetical protein
MCVEEKFFELPSDSFYSSTTTNDESCRSESEKILHVNHLQVTKLPLLRVVPMCIIKVVDLLLSRNIYIFSHA